MLGPWDIASLVTIFRGPAGADVLAADTSMFGASLTLGWHSCRPDVWRFAQTVGEVESGILEAAQAAFPKPLRHMRCLGHHEALPPGRVR